MLPLLDTLIKQQFPANCACGKGAKITQGQAPLFPKSLNLTNEIAIRGFCEEELMFSKTNGKNILKN
jgi:hypothetical protein